MTSSTRALRLRLRFSPGITWDLKLKELSRDHVLVHGQATLGTTPSIFSTKLSWALPISVGHTSRELKPSVGNGAGQPAKSGSGSKEQVQMHKCHWADISGSSSAKNTVSLHVQSPEGVFKDVELATGEARPHLGSLPITRVLGTTEPRVNTSDASSYSPCLRRTTLIPSPGQIHSAKKSFKCYRKWR